MNRVNKLVLIILCFCFGVYSVEAFAQQWYIDSIQLLLQKKPSNETKADFYLKLAKSYRNLDPNLGLRYADSCLEMATSLKNSKIEAEAINEMGVLYRKMDMYELAMEKHQAALAKFEKIDDKMGIAFALANVGNVYQALEQYEKSLDFNLQSLKLKREIGDDEQLAYSLRTSGLAYLALKDYEQAERFFEEALHLYQKIDELYGVGNVYLHLGNVSYARDANKTKALEYYEKATEIYNLVKNKFGTALSKYEMAKAHMEMDHTEIAQQLFIETIAETENTHSTKLKMDVFREYSKFFKKQGDYQNALVYYEKYSALRDTLLAEKTGKNIAEIQIKYDISRKETQIEILKNQQKLNTAWQLFYILAIFFVSTLVVLIYLRYRDKKKINHLLEKEIEARKIKEQELLESKRKLTEASATKDKFFSIISHDLKNPIGAIMGIAELLTEDYTTLSEEERKEMVGEILKSTQNTYSLLEDLLAWSRSQRGVITFLPTETEVLGLCRENIDFISATAMKKNIQIDCNISAGVKIKADQNMFTTIIRNLLSNAVKFSYPHGKVMVSSNQFSENTNGKTTHFIEITVADNGVGISAENQKKLFRIDENFKSTGTMKETGTGLGLIICKEFVEIHGGRLNVISEPGKGSSFKLILPFNPRSATINAN